MFSTAVEARAAARGDLENRVPDDDREVSARDVKVERRPARETSLSQDHAADEPESYDLVSRLISETAHDLRAPLSTIREAVRLVRDGELGDVSIDQRECLSAAMNQCNCAAQLVDEMVQTRQFDSGFPNVRRDWISIDDLRRSVEATLQPWMMPRGIHLLWDGPFGKGGKVYGDETLLRRLIVNLASNAVRVTRDGQPVLIRAKSDRERGVMIWSVVDQGNGISLSDMELIGAGKAPSRSLGGLGLMISRRLATAHFSTLRIESRVGTGTAVTFQTPFGSPVDVVECWSRWRCRSTAPNDSRVISRRQQVHDLFPSRSQSTSETPVAPRRVRIDVPSHSVELGDGDQQPAYPDHVYLATVSLGAAVGASCPDRFDALLQRTMRITELAYRTGRRSWVIAWDADAEAGIGKRMELERLCGNEIDGLRMTWGTSSVISPSSVAAAEIEKTGVPLASRLADLIVRETLSAAQRVSLDADQVRLGTAPLPPSSTAVIRLEREVRRLLERRQCQSV